MPVNCYIPPPPPYVTSRIFKQSQWNLKDTYYVRKSFFWYTSRRMMTSHHVTITSKCQNSRHLGSAILDIKIFQKKTETTQNYWQVHKINKIVLKNRKKVRINCIKVNFH